MMKKDVLAKKLAYYANYEGNVRFDEAAPDFCSLHDAETEDYLGEATFDEEGRFTSFSFDFYEEEADEAAAEQAEVPFSEEEIKRMLSKATEFAKDFASPGAQFSLMSEWGDNQCMVIFEEVDPKLASFIPHTGCIIYIDREGALQGASIGMRDFSLEYPEVEISAEEAKGILREAKPIECVIAVDDTLRPKLIYRMNPYIIGVKVDGSLDSLHEFLDVAPLSRKAFEKVQPDTTLLEMLGITDSFELIKDDGESKLWLDTNQPAELLDEMIADEEEDVPVHTVSFFKNETGTFIASEAAWDPTQPKLTREEIEARAILFMQLLDEESHLNYQIEDEFMSPDEDELDEEMAEAFNDLDEDELHLLTEPTSMVTFVRSHKGFELEGMDATVHVGLYSGLIRECSLQGVQEEALHSLSVVPSYSIENAEKRFFDELQMKLVRTVKSIDDREVLDLSYTINFPGEQGFIEEIDAHSGDVTYVETGILREGKVEER